MASCCGYQENSRSTHAGPAKFWYGLTLGLSLWVVLVGTLVIA